MKIAVDSGHGFANDTDNIFDPGAVCGLYEEATIALAYGMAFQRALFQQNIPNFLTRTDNSTPAPLRDRVFRATRAQCTHLISFHCNSNENPLATGTEVLYFRPQNRKFAENTLNIVCGQLNLRKREVIERPKLRILKFAGPAVLIELGFISNAEDRRVLVDHTIREATCDALARALVAAPNVRE